MKSWRDLTLSPHEGGTKYIVDLQDKLDSQNPLRQHINRSVTRHPGRWVLVFEGSGVGDVKLDGLLPGIITKNVRLRASSVETRRYTRTHVRIYAHDGSNTDPLELVKQADSLPGPSFEIPLDDWVLRLQLPYVDMTDGGFNWTQDELREATNLAMKSLHSGKSVTYLIGQKARKEKKRLKQDAVERLQPQA